MSIMADGSVCLARQIAVRSADCFSLFCFVANCFCSRSVFAPLVLFAAADVKDDATRLWFGRGQFRNPDNNNDNNNRPITAR